MLRVLTAIARAAGLAATLAAQAPTADAFKLGTFRQQGRTFAGAIVRDTLVEAMARIAAPDWDESLAEDWRQSIDLLGRHMIGHG